MRNMGNARAKLIYEAALPAGYPRPREGAPSQYSLLAFHPPACCACACAAV